MPAARRPLAAWSGPAPSTGSGVVAVPLVCIGGGEGDLNLEKNTSSRHITTGRRNISASKYQHCLSLGCPGVSEILVLPQQQGPEELDPLFK